MVYVTVTNFLFLYLSIYDLLAILNWDMQSLRTSPKAGGGVHVAVALINLPLLC